jgi:hypothetical protein
MISEMRSKTSANMMKFFCADGGYDRHPGQ